VYSPQNVFLQVYKVRLPIYFVASRANDKERIAPTLDGGISAQTL
jgi:hypothetical protein